MTEIVCKNCGAVYDSDEIEENSDINTVEAVLCEQCGEHLADVLRGRIILPSEDIHLTGVDAVMWALHKQRECQIEPLKDSEWQ